MSWTTFFLCTMHSCMHAYARVHAYACACVRAWVSECVRARLCVWPHACAFVLDACEEPFFCVEFPQLSCLMKCWWCASISHTNMLKRLCKLCALNLLNFCSCDNIWIPLSESKNVENTNMKSSVPVFVTPNILTFAYVTPICSNHKRYACAYMCIHITQTAKRVHVTIHALYMPSYIRVLDV